MTASARTRETTDERARENREYVHRLLKSKQPRFAAALETAFHELLDGLFEPAGTGSAINRSTRRHAYTQAKIFTRTTGGFTDRRTMLARRMNPRIAVSVVFVVAMFMTVMDIT